MTDQIKQPGEPDPAPDVSRLPLDTVEQLLRAGALDEPNRPGLPACIDRFEILRVVGIGGMSVVLLARDPHRPAPVAIKLLKPELTVVPQAVRWFLAEARRMMNLSHPSILEVLEVADRADGPYFVMPYMKLGSLAQRMVGGKPLEDAETLGIASEIAAALNHAHSKGLIHRDLKPGNVLLDEDGRAYLADFGLGRTVYHDSIVDAGQKPCVGTVQYMSPGVARGEAEDTRCDIYSFGAVLYEMLTGEPPYDGYSFEEIRQSILAGPPVAILQRNPKAPAGLVTIAEGAMARELRDRYAEMSDVVTDLERVAGGQPALGPRGKRRRRTVLPWLAAGLVCLFLLVVAAALNMLPGQKTPPEPTQGPPPTPAASEAGSTSRRTGPLLFQEDFAGPGPDLPLGWRTSRGKWVVAGGTLSVEMPERYCPAVAFAPAASWRDYAVECEMRVDQAMAGILFRHNEEDRFYGFVVQLEQSPDDGVYRSVQFGKYFPSEDWQVKGGMVYANTLLWQEEYTWERGPYHRVRIEVVGSQMSAYIDGVLVLKAQDKENVIHSGSIGLLAHDALLDWSGRASFRKLRVEQIGQPDEEPVAAKEPARVIAAWEFNEGQGTTVHDASGCGNDGTLQGGATWVDGRDGKAVRLDGKSGFIQVPHGPSQSGIKQLTIHVVFQLHSYPRHVSLVKKWGTGGREDDAFCLDVIGNGVLSLQLDVNAALDTHIAHIEHIPLEKWVEVVGIYDGFRITLYARIEDGPWMVHEGPTLPKQIQESPVRDTEEPIEIGSDDQHREFLDATIDRLQITSGREVPKGETQPDH